MADTNWQRAATNPKLGQLRGTVGTTVEHNQAPQVRRGRLADPRHTNAMLGPIVEVVWLGAATADGTTTRTLASC